MVNIGPEEKSIWLTPWIDNRLKHNKNVIALFVGDTGSGKSYCALRTAENADPNFNVDRIAFTVEEIVKLVNSDLPRGSAIVFDDAGLGVNAREWQKQSAKIFGMLTQGFRYKQLVTLITTPKMWFIERQSRMLIHLLLQATDVQGIMKPKIPFNSPYYSSSKEEIWYKYPVIQRGYKKITIKTIRFAMPSKELVEAYEERKTEYMEKRFTEFEDELSGRRKPRGEGINLTCGNCGYKWEYRGLLRTAKCPDCGAAVYVVEKEDTERGYDVRCDKCQYKWRFTGHAERTTCPNCEQKIRPKDCRINDDDEDSAVTT